MHIHFFFMENVFFIRPKQKQGIPPTEHIYSTAVFVESGGSQI